MKTKGKNIGKGMGILWKFNGNVAEIHEDIDMMEAPSECHALASRGDQKRFRLVRRHIKAVTGLKMEAFLKEAERRTSPKWMWATASLPHVREGKIRAW